MSAVSPRIRFPRRLTVLLFVLLPWSWACSDDPVGPDGGDVQAREVGVVVNSVDISVTIFDTDDPTGPRTVGLGPDGSPVSLAVRGDIAAVPLGVVPAVAVVDLPTATLLRTVGLPEGSGATGAAFVNDSIVVVANPNLGTVSPVNVRSGVAGDPVPVGRFPQAVLAVEDRVYVLNAELENFAPAGPATITVLAGEELTPLDTIELSGENAAAAALGPDGRLYVLHSGNFGAADGALSIVDVEAGIEVSFVQGFGEFPGSLIVAPDGRVYVGGFGLGTLVWSSISETFERGLSNPIAPGGLASTSGVGVDGEGRVYTLAPDCQAPAVAHRLDSGLVSEETVPVGICPIAIGFTQIGGV